MVDKLTNSIQSRVTGESFGTSITLLTRRDLADVPKKHGWNFDWRIEMRQPKRELYKLALSAGNNLIQGLISLEIKPDHVYIHLIESAPNNKGRCKVYLGVPGNLIAFACRVSFQNGFKGNVAFHSKTLLIRHYVESIGAFHAGGSLMIIETGAALDLIRRYFKFDTL